MPRKWSLVAVGVGMIAAFELGTYRFHRKYEELFELTYVVEQDNKSLTEQMKYLVNKLNEHQINLDEFDLIVLPNVKKQV